MEKQGVKEKKSGLMFDLKQKGGGMNDSQPIIPINNVSSYFLGPISFDLTSPRPFKALRNANVTGRMTAGFVVVSQRHTEARRKRLPVKIEKCVQRKMLELFETGHLFKEQLAKTQRHEENKA